MTVILLAEPQTRGELRKRLRNSGFPVLAQRLSEIDPDVDDDVLVPRVLTVRSEAQKFIDEHRDAAPPIELDARNVAVLTAPFVDALLQAWPEATFLNLDPYGEEVVEVVQRRRQRGSG